MMLIEKLEQLSDEYLNQYMDYGDKADLSCSVAVDDAIAIVKKHQGEDGSDPYEAGFYDGVGDRCRHHGCAIWVSVSERLPEIGERVLTFTASGIETLYRSQYDNDLFIWERDCCQDYWTDEEVTHWQPLPQPPEQ